jgi:RNA polymerase sigma-70 factor, ECF subfamily
MIGTLLGEGMGATAESGARGAARRRGTADLQRAATEYRAFVEGHLDEAYRLATHILGAPADGEDAVHDAAVSAWRHWQDRRDHDRTEAWFRRIVVNACRDKIRAKGRLRMLPVGLAPQLPRRAISPDGAVAVDERDALDRLLRPLGVDDRVLLTLRFSLDLTVPAIAAVLRVREGTVKSRLHRALASVRAELESRR